MAESTPPAAAPPAATAGPNYPFDYAVIRLVPDLVRGEALNAGVVLRCSARRYLAARVALPDARLRLLAPDLDPAEIARHLDIIPRICRGGPDSGPIGALSLSERWHWLVAPRSTIIQVSPAHSGLCAEPGLCLARLFGRVVGYPHPPAPSPRARGEGEP